MLRGIDFEGDRGEIVALEGPSGSGKTTFLSNRRLNPQDPAKPIDARVLLVKVAFTESTPLKLGQRVEVRVD